MGAVIYNRIYIKVLFSLLWLFFYTPYSQAQDQSNKASYKTVVAGPEYDRGTWHQKLWGKHYRKEWITPVQVPVVMLDTLRGGLKPYRAGGSRQSKNLRLKDNDGREYVLRSIDKSFSNALPPIYRGTFIENIANDQASIAHPYAAVTIAPMAEAANVYHTIPDIIYVPKQSALGEFNDTYGDALYLFEQRADENWDGAENFGNSENIISTDRLFKKLHDDNDNIVDQEAFVRARLFDMLIGDWGRHEDQWRWAKFKEGDKKVYRPIPRDRDQAYTKFDGVLLGIVLSAADMSYVESFDYKIHDSRKYSYPARNIDRALTNEVTLQQWQAIARQLQADISDSIIDYSIKQLPPEIYPISGEEIAAKLKSRRDHLEEYAEEYYKFLTKEVEVVGTKGTEYFDVNRLNDEETEVKLYNIDKKGKTESDPYYSRTFQKHETKEVRLYGLGGEDKFNIHGKVDRGIVVRIIGGTDKDEIVDNSYVAKGIGHKTVVYDDADNYFQPDVTTRLHIADDSNINSYKYNAFYYDKKGIKLSFFYNNPDRFYVRLGYKWRKYKWRKEPFGFENGVYVAYSLSQNAFSFLYEGTYNQLFGKWNLKLNAFQDAIRWQNFYGLGNETKQLNTNVLYYRLRTSELTLSAALERYISKHHKIGLSGFFQTVTIINDNNRFVTDSYPALALNRFDEYYFAGLQAYYTYQNVNDPVIPTKGIGLNLNAGYTQDFTNASRSFGKFGADTRIYIPLVNKFSLAIFTGATAIAGTPEFFQYPTIGGSLLLRGYRRERFRGQTIFYDSNELRWITDFRSHICNGKIGLVGFLDDGRVWMPEESSGTLHVGYGGGFLLAPFNKFMVSVTYGISDEAKLFHVRFNKPL
jgi:hypothetical protein